LVFQYNGHCSEDGKPETTGLLQPEKLSIRLPQKLKPTRKNSVEITTSGPPNQREIPTSQPVKNTKINTLKPSDLQSGHQGHRQSHRNDLIPHTMSKDGITPIECLEDCVCGLVLYPVCGSNRITYGKFLILLF